MCVYVCGVNRNINLNYLWPARIEEKTISATFEIVKDIGKSFASFIKLQTHKFIGDISSGVLIVVGLQGTFFTYMLHATHTDRPITDMNRFVFRSHFIRMCQYVWMNRIVNNNLCDVRIAIPVSNSFHFLFRQLRYLMIRAITKYKKWCEMKCTYVSIVYLHNIIIIVSYIYIYMYRIGYEFLPLVVVHTIKRIWKKKSFSISIAINLDPFRNFIMDFIYLYFVSSFSW